MNERRSMNDKRGIMVVLVFFMVGVIWAGVAVKKEEKFSRVSQRIQVSSLEYKGAFRLPEGEGGSEVKNWLWSGEGITYYPGGDVSGPDDGFTGSLYATGHNWSQMVSEIAIPVPVISAGKDLEDLNTATTLQGFRDIMNVSSVEMPHSDLQYLPAQGAQGSGKIHFCRGAHLEEENMLTHGWCELNLSNPQVAGFWTLSGCISYSTNDYLMDIPSQWAASHAPGYLLGTGRFRDGGWSGQGPSLYAIGPWSQGNPPANGTGLNNLKLLQYSSTLDFETPQYTMTDYQHADEWSGGAWLTAGDQSAVVFVGTKGWGKCWYGFANGVEWPDEPPYPPIPDPPNNVRGWWSTGFEGQMIFYDTDDLAAVAHGSQNPWEPQPYATLDIDTYLFNINSTQQKSHVGACAFDRQHGYLYVIEPLVDSEKSIIHVWKVKSGGGGPTQTGSFAFNRTALVFGATVANPATHSQEFRVRNSGEGTMNWTASTNASWLSVSPGSGSNSGLLTVTINSTGLPVGQYKGNVILTSVDAVNSPGVVAVTLNVYAVNGSLPPFGVFESPGNGETVCSSIPVTGWVLDDILVESVKIYLQDAGVLTYIGEAVLVEGARPDVEGLYPGYPLNYKAGWGYMMLTNYLPGNGNGTYTLYIEATDSEGNRAELGTAVIMGDNIHAVKPFGAIDKPEQGGTVSGDRYLNWGWVLTPMPNMIPIDGTTIDVYVDGVRVGSPVYNLPREDVQSLFPGYANSNGAIGYYYLDTTAFENGIHTIQWTATDNAGNTDGIGSRFFTIQNSGTSRTMDSRFVARGQGRQPVVGDDSKDKGEPEAKGEKDQFTIPGKRGIISIAELQCIKVKVKPGSNGFMKVGDDWRPLPAGSYLDRERGVFYWQPGPGFVGKYGFIFTNEGQARELTVHITRGKYQ